MPLLYAEGHQLDELVALAFRELGAQAEKISKEKEDIQLTLPGRPLGIVEVKATHNARFGSGAVTQLGRWMDEVMASNGIGVKGIFVGNAERFSPPSARGPLFESESERFAKLRKITLIRSLNLYTAVLLSNLGIIKADDFWQQLFSTEGNFDSKRYLESIPPPFTFSRIEAGDAST